ncbi:MAG: acetyl-CoA acetyltransferase [Candidatus Hecatellales archaeon B24]|nr:MAG: acetyl-CoA acetyltransferase [Candidatus Hecatellales archaeon B24]
MRKTAIIGVGCTKVGEFWDKSLRDLAVEASWKALDQAGVSKVDALYVGSALCQLVQNQGNLGALIADSLSLYGVEVLSVEASDASGALALHEACRAVGSGEVNLALAVGVDKPSDASSADASKALMAGVEQEYLAYTGVNVRGLAAFLHRLYRERFKVSHEEVAAMAVNSHLHASNNPYAQYRNRITVEQVMKSPVIADPLRLLEVSSLGDGAAAVLVCPLEEAGKYAGTPIEVAGAASASGDFILTEAEDMLSFKATRLAAEKAYRRAGITIKDVSLAEVHDCADVIGLISLEDLGLAERGEAAGMAASGKLAVGGSLPTNTMGGLKARGNPGGATSLYQIVEICWQLKGEAGANQVSNAKVGVAQSLGGLYSLAAVTVLRRV